jgi:Aminopeptidase N
MNKLLILFGLLLILLVTLQAPAQTLEHKMSVELVPSLKILKGTDTLTFPPKSPRKASFLLHKDLVVTVASPGDSIVVLHPAAADSPFVEYGLELGAQDNKVTLDYQGVIYDPVVNEDSRGLIAPEGATLFGSTYWYPFILDTQVTFDVTVKTPKAWTSLVQGEMSSLSSDAESQTARFVQIYPQEEIYLVAGPFKKTVKEMKNGIKLQILLRGDDNGLSTNLLSVLPDYINHYSQILGAYPYKTFSVVENFWETGYGMPGFTLLGPTVVRLPFILTSSLPHEVLHNWWGNGVYVDYDRGNWSEGLTTYMSDYWQQELSGQDRDYRLSALMSYSDYVTTGTGKDFPLKDFKGRHNASSQAIGYSKAMMFFHMLDFQMGRDAFQKSLQDFYQNNLFKRASYDDLLVSFEKVSGRSLSGLFAQWTERTGAAHLELGDVRMMMWHGGSFSTSYVLAQKGAENYELNVPVIWKLENGEEIRQWAKLTESSQVFNLISRSRPVKVEVDPEFHIFRDLYLEERPATLSGIFGAKEVHFFPQSASADQTAFAGVWKKQIAGKSYLHAVGEAVKPEQDGMIVLIGDSVEARSFMKSQLTGQNYDINGESLFIHGQEYSLMDGSFVIVTRRKENPSQLVAWVRWSADNSSQDWASRLTHYGKYGILVFKGRPNVLKSTWPTLESPLKRKL